MESAPPPIPSQPKRGWWARNWMWFVPTGCFTLIVLFAVFVGSIVMIVFGAIKSTDVYKDALARAKAHPAVVEALGSPIKEGLLVSGNTNVNGASGEASLSIPISGPKGKGTIYVKAEKSLGRWNYSDLVVEIQKTGERIDLVRSPPPSERL
jgi:hypothetical protein